MSRADRGTFKSHRRARPSVKVKREAMRPQGGILGDSEIRHPDLQGVGLPNGKGVMKAPGSAEIQNSHSYQFTFFSKRGVRR